MLSAILLSLVIGQKPFDPAKERVIAVTTPTAIYIFAGQGNALDWRMTIPVSGPIPPGPGPQPQPELTDVGKLSKAEAEKLPAGPRAKSKDVGAALRKAGQEVMDNALSKPADVLALVRSKTNTALGADADAWKMWGVAVALKFKDANPTTPAAWANLLQQAAEGVEGVQ